jgi:sulfur-oxidizing protein SoxY
MKRYPRRRFFALAATAIAAPALFARRARAQVPALDPAIAAITRGAPISKGRVKLEIPALADNGNSVLLKVTVDSGMSTAERIKSIHLVSEKNPVRTMASYYFGPRAGRAEVATRVRLAGSQTITALAQFSDGSFWMDTAETVVTSSACLDES